MIMIKYAGNMIFLFIKYTNQLTNGSEKSHTSYKQ